MFVSLQFSCRESPPEFLEDLPNFEKQNRPTPQPTLDSSPVCILLVPESFFSLSSFPFPPFLLFFPSFLSSCPPFFLFLFGIIAIIQLHHNRKKAVFGSCFIVVEFLSPPKRYKKGGFKSFLSPFFSTPWLTSIIFESFLRTQQGIVKEVAVRMLEGAPGRSVTWPHISCVGSIEQVSSRRRAQTRWCSEHDQVRYLHNLVSLRKEDGGYFLERSVSYTHLHGQRSSERCQGQPSKNS